MSATNKSDEQFFTEAGPQKTLAEWQSGIGSWAQSKGWWERFEQYGVAEPHSGSLIDGQARNHYIASKLALVTSEISEALEALREGHVKHYVMSGKPEGLEIELADAIIRILDLANALGLDMGRAVAVKMNYNAHRSYRHGGKAM